MANQPHSEAVETHSLPAMPNFTPSLWGIALLVLGLVLAGFYLVTQYTASDQNRELSHWQEKLNLIAESRVDEVSHWVGEHFQDLRQLSDNPSLQLYMTELGAAQGKPAITGEAADSGQRAYLRNLLLFTAQRSGFGSGGNASGIPANVQTAAKSGLMITDNSGNPVVSTQMQPVTQDIMVAGVKDAAPGKEALLDIAKYNDGTPYMGFVLPVYSIQGEHDAQGQIGRVVALKALDKDFYGLLPYPGVSEKTLEVLLIRQKDGKIQFLSPLQDGSEPLGKEIESSVKGSESALLETPGQFVSDLKDYRSKPVLATSRAVPGTPWTLVVKVDRQEALAASDQRRASRVTVMLMLIAIIVLIVITTWWRAHSRRAVMESAYFQSLAERSRAQEKLLRLVADNQPEPVYILDKSLTYRFANAQAASGAGMSPGSVVGKRLADVRGGSRAEPIADECEKALTSHEITHDMQRYEQSGQTVVIRGSYVPIDHIPVEGLPVPTPGVLVVEQDISEAVAEKERRIGIQHQLMQTLLRLVDKRDPNAANHSQMVSHLAMEMAQEMELDNITAETARIAGNLMNIGKIVVPAELLTKAGSLTAPEKKQVRESMDAAADLLDGIPFDGPVAETLRQWQERWDGSGPLGLKGEAILITARIIAVANAYASMVSPRSWRQAMSLEAANKSLLEQAETQFDRRVVVALISYVDNHGGGDWLRKLLAQKGAA